MKKSIGLLATAALAAFLEFLCKGVCFHSFLIWSYRVHAIILRSEVNPVKIPWLPKYSRLMRICDFAFGDAARHGTLNYGGMLSHIGSWSHQNGAFKQFHALPKGAIGEGLRV